VPDAAANCNSSLRLKVSLASQLHTLYTALGAAHGQTQPAAQFRATPGTWSKNSTAEISFLGNFGAEFLGLQNYCQFYIGKN